MNRLICLLLLALAPALALAQSESCPRIWRSGDSLLTDPAPHIQWLRNGVPIPNANQRWHLPSEAGQYSVASTGEASGPYQYPVVRGYVLAGWVFDELHRPIDGATVRHGQFSATTNDHGRFVLMIDAEKPAEETPVVVSIEKSGYWRNASRQYISAFQTTETQIMLHTKRVTNRVEATEGGHLAYRGFTLQIPPDAVQTESGTPYSGTILLSVEGARPTEADFGLRMPGGNFEAIDDQGNNVMLYSYGYMSVEMATEGGEKLELRPEARATLRFSLPYTETHRPDSVPLWHFDRDRALWVQEGWSYRNGSIYEGEVSHFSDWNCDIPAERSTVRGRLIDCNGNPCAGCGVGVGQRQVLTDSLGQYWTFVPGDLVFDVWTQGDTLTQLTVPAMQQRTLDDLMGHNFAGVALFDPQAQQVTFNLVGNLPTQATYSINGGESYSSNWVFSSVSQLAGEQIHYGLVRTRNCLVRVPVRVLEKTDDCRFFDIRLLDSVVSAYDWQEALNLREALVSLDLSGNNFQDRADLLLHFPCLAVLNLNQNQLVGLPEEIGTLTNLQVLFLYFNNLTSLPASFGNLVALKRLEIPYNQLRALPESFGNLSELNRLVLGYNRLTTLPASCANLKKLRELYLDNNQFRELPAWIGELDELYYLVLHNNQLTDLPPSIASLADTLSDLFLEGNPIPVERRAAIQAMLPNTRIRW